LPKMGVPRMVSYLIKDFFGRFKTRRTVKDQFHSMLYSGTTFVRKESRSEAIHIDQIGYNNPACYDLARFRKRHQSLAPDWTPPLGAYES